MSHVPPFYVAFHSLRGGVGRTMAALNCATRLALDGDRIVVIDLDLEAPGLSLLWGQGQAQERSGFVEFAIDALRDDQIPDLTDYLHKIRSESAKFYFMPAGRWDNQYGKRLSEIDFRVLFDEKLDGRGCWLLDGLKAAIEKSISPHYAIIDSRPGLTPPAAVATSLLANLVIEVFTLSRQNRLGLREFLPIMRRKLEPETSIVPFASMVLSSDEAQEAMNELEQIWGKPFFGRCKFDENLFLRERAILEDTDVSRAYAALVRSVRTRNKDDLYSLVEQAWKNLRTEGGLIAVEAAIERTNAIDPNDIRLLRLRAHYHQLRQEPDKAIEIARCLVDDLHHAKNPQTWRLIQDLAASVEDGPLRRDVAELYAMAPDDVSIPSKFLEAREAQLLEKAFAPAKQALDLEDFEQKDNLMKSTLEKLKDAAQNTEGTDEKWWKAAAQRLPVSGSTRMARRDWLRWEQLAKVQSVDELRQHISDELRKLTTNLRGTVSNFGWKEFGFIRLEDGESDVYFERDGCTNAPTYVRIGSPVVCDIQCLKDYGRWRATRVEFLS